MNNNYNDTTTTMPSRAAAPSSTGNTNHPIFFEDDQLDNNDDISASIDFTPSPSFSLPHHHYFNNNQEVLFSMSLGDDGGQPWRPPPPPAPLIPTGNFNKEESGGFMSSLLSVPSYNIRMQMSNIVDHMNIGSCYFPSTSSCLTGTTPFSLDKSAGINFTAGIASLFLGNDYNVSVHDDHEELEFQGDNIGGIFQPDSAMARFFNCSTADLQALSSESQHLLHGSPSTTLASEISSLEDPYFKVAKLSVEERKMKIHRYLKKRNERNFSKKIKYACRKTLADSRPRVRGRFVKNDELAETAKFSTGRRNNHDQDDTDEDITLFSNPNISHHHHNKVVKGEEDLVSSNIFAHISGVNSFKCNYPIQSWI